MRQEWVGKRQAVRTSVQLRAQMRFEGGRPPVDCTIMDISLTGARLTLPDAGPYPDDFDIFIPARSETKWARIRWREDLQIGVEFLKGRRNEHDPTVTKILARLGVLEKQIGEGRLPQAPGSPPAPESPQAHARTEARLAALEAAPRSPASSQSALDNPWLEAMLDRLTHVEARCAGLEAEVQRCNAVSGEANKRTSDLVARIEGLERAPPAEAAELARPAEPVAPPTLVHPNDEVAAIESRLRGMEGSVSDMRGSLQALILLLSAQITRKRKDP